MLAITMTAFRRPDYTKQVLEALAQCKGIENFVFFPQIEPGHETVISQFNSWDKCEIRSVVNVSVQGLNRNTRLALDRAYKAKAETVVHLEDDIVLSTDALEYFVWAVEEIVADSSRVMSACGYNREKATSKETHLVGLRNIFNCWGWATHRVKLAWMFSKWTYTHPTKFTRVFRAKYSSILEECYPKQTRVQNIGCYGSTNHHTPTWYQRTHHNPYFKTTIPTGKFHLQK